MSYPADCDADDCDTSGVVPDSDEAVVRGTRMYRTQSEQAAAYRAEAGPGADLPNHIPRWTHYCPEHARELGIAPDPEGAH